MTKMWETIVAKIGWTIFWGRLKSVFGGKKVKITQREVEVPVPGGRSIKYFEKITEVSLSKETMTLVDGGVESILTFPATAESMTKALIQAEATELVDPQVRAKEIKNKKDAERLVETPQVKALPEKEKLRFRVFTFIAYGDESFHSQAYPEAESAYGEAYEFAQKLDDKPIRVICLNLIGAAVGMQGEHEKALSYFKEAISLEPDFAPAWYSKGTALFMLELYEEAIPCYDEAIRLKPDFTSAWNNKGTALFELELYEEAISCYDEVIRLNPDDAEAWSNKGAVLVKLGRNKQAFTCLNEAIRVDENWGMAWYNKGLVLVKMGKIDDSVACFEKSIEIDKNNASFWYNKGVSLGILARYEESIICFEKAIEIEGNNAAPWYNKGFSLAKLKKKEEALACFRKATEIDENLADAWYNQAIILSTLGLDAYSESKRCFKRTFAIRDRLLNNGASLYRAWARLILSHEMVHLYLGNMGTVKNLAKDFDRLRKMAESDSMDQVLKDAEKDYKAEFYKGKAKFLEELLRG